MHTSSWDGMINIRPKSKAKSSCVVHRKYCLPSIDASLTSPLASLQHPKSKANLRWAMARTAMYDGFLAISLPLALWRPQPPKKGYYVSHPAYAYMYTNKHPGETHTSADGR
jgi:hypothetical protein